MTTDEGEQTWDEGRLTEHDVIEAADGTGYTSMSEFVAGENGYEPDDTYASDSYDADADDIDDSGGF